MTPRASFIIPAYNAERWISKAIFSCRNQTIKQIEILVVNDGSTDGTQEIVEAHIQGSSITGEPEKRLRLFNQENKGRSAARNLGNDQATSNLLLVLDADDMATRNRVKDTITLFELKKPDFLYGSFFIMDSMGVTERKMICGPFDPQISKEKKLNFICHSTVAYTKKVSEIVRYEEGDWSRLGLDDWKFQWEVHKKGYRIIHSRNPLCYYRATEDGTMATRDPAEVLKAKEEYLAHV